MYSGTLRYYCELYRAAREYRGMGNLCNVGLAVVELIFATINTFISYLTFNKNAHVMWKNNYISKLCFRNITQILLLS